MSHQRQEEPNYLVRLREIRQKYNCSQPHFSKISNSITNTHHSFQHHELRQNLRRSAHGLENTLSKNEFIMPKQKQTYQDTYKFNRKSPKLTKENIYNSEIFKPKGKAQTYLNSFQNNYQPIKSLSMLSQKCQNCQINIYQPVQKKNLYQQSLNYYQAPIHTKSYTDKFQEKYIKKHIIPNNTMFKNKFVYRDNPQNPNKIYNLDSLTKIQQKIQIALKNNVH